MNCNKSSLTTVELRHNATLGTEEVAVVERLGMWGGGGIVFPWGSTFLSFKNCLVSHVNMLHNQNISIKQRPTTFDMGQVL